MRKPTAFKTVKLESGETVVVAVYPERGSRKQPTMKLRGRQTSDINWTRKPK